MPILNKTSEIAALVHMPYLLAALNFDVNERTRRCACNLHGGSNPSAFAWTDTGLWKCHSCGAGGDRIDLVRAVRQCGFAEAVSYLAQIAGVEYCARSVSRREIEHRQERTARAERSAWRIADEIGRLRGYYTDALHRAERLQARIGNELLRSSTEAAKDTLWERLAQLAPGCAFFFAAWNFTCDAKPDVLARFALASPAKRRSAILEGDKL